MANSNITKESFSEDGLVLTNLHTQEGDWLKLYTYEQGGASLTFPTAFRPVEFFRRALARIIVNGGYDHTMEVWRDGEQKNIPVSDLPYYQDDTRRIDIVRLFDEKSGIHFGWQSLPLRSYLMEGGLVAPNHLSREILEPLLHATGSTAISAASTELTDEILDLVN